MTWTKRLPTEDGYYWWRRCNGHHREIVYVCNGTVHYIAKFLRRPVREQAGEWYGPLVEPVGDAAGGDDREAIWAGAYRHDATPGAANR